MSYAIIWPEVARKFKNSDNFDSYRFHFMKPTILVVQDVEADLLGDVNVDQCSGRRVT